jgi:hypothetical protein
MNRRGKSFSPEALILAAALGGTAVVAALGERIGVFAEGVPPSPPAPAATTPGGLPNYLQEPRAASDRVNELAKRTRGDFNRLTDLEQRWINSMTAGYGHQLLRMRTRLLGIKPEGSPPRQRPKRPAS